MTPDERADRLAAVVIGCTARTHGTRRAHDSYGCRCPEAVEAVRSREKFRRPIGHRTGPRSRDQYPDPVAIDRALAGDRSVYLTVLELGIAIAALTARGFSARAVGVRLGVSDRTVTRHRAGLVRNARLDTTGSVHRLSRDSSTAVLDSTDHRDAA